VDLSKLARDTNDPLTPPLSGPRFDKQLVGPIATMNTAEFLLRGFSDPRLALHATSPLPAWLWSTDGSHILWANPVGAIVFGAANGASLCKQSFGPADAHRRQVAQLAHRLPASGAVRLERLRGFGATLGMLVTCSCARLDLAEGGEGILIVASGLPGRPMPLAERFQRLVQGIDAPIAAFTADGIFVTASRAARPLPDFHNFSGAGFDELRGEALAQGRAETRLDIGQMVLQRVGVGADVGLIAMIAPEANGAAPIKHGVSPTAPAAATPLVTPQISERIAPPGDLPVPEYERPAMSGEAPAEFALIDEFADEFVNTSEPAEPTATEVSNREPSPASIETPHEESPIKAGAALDEAPSSAAETPGMTEASVPPSVARQAFNAPSGLQEPSSQQRRYPLRFMWQMDGEGRFSISRDEFTHLIGVRTAAGFGRPWGEIAKTFGLDPEGRVANAIATRSTWSGIVLQWPVDDGGRLPVELSGLPIYDHTGGFSGYRGFGVCRDLDELARLEILRRQELATDQVVKEAVSSGAVSIAASVNKTASADAALAEPPGVTKAEGVAAFESEILQESGPEKPVEPADDALKNVVPFRPIGEPRAPLLTPVENSAFDELARQLSARLEGEDGAKAQRAREAMIEPLVLAENAGQPFWMAQAEPPALGESARDRMLLDLLPDGMLIYRLDRLLYANPAFLRRIGYPSLHALEQAGGLDALYVEPGVSSASSTSDTGTPVTISAQGASSEAAPASAIEARLYAINWDGESAHALIFAGSGPPDFGAATNVRPPPPVKAPSAQAPSEAGHADMQELAGADMLHDFPRIRKSESEIHNAQHLAEANARAELLARISHEIRAPLNAIIGFAEVMIGERFGTLGNERYAEYLKDIRASGERVTAIIGELTDLSRIETGRLELALTPQNLNDLVESCVAQLQPQASRERIIIRTSLAPALPPVAADARTLRQIAENLILNSIHLAEAGGQVIVSTALTDFGDVVLRVRDTGHGLNNDEIAAAMAPFRTQGPSDLAEEGSPVSLSLTRALAEANQAKFRIRTGARSGTLIEVAFSRAAASGSATDRRMFT
jgi:signal transduction histidine kinase